MTCTTCGAELPEGTATCPTCGAGVPATVGGSTAAAGAGADHPSGYSSEARNWALGAHLSAFLGSFVAMAFVGPLVVWLIRKDSDPFSTRHAREALNFNLTLLLVIVVGGVALIPLALLTIGLIIIPFALAAVAIGLGWIVLTIVAAVKAAEGREYRYPLTIRFVR